MFLCISLSLIFVAHSVCSAFFFSRLVGHPVSPLFPYTTLFRSDRSAGDVSRRGAGRRGVDRGPRGPRSTPRRPDRKSTRLNSSHQIISYAVFCLKKKKKKKKNMN